MKDANMEATKEVARWLVFFVISWVVSEVLRQAAVIPVSYDLYVWKFVFSIPIRSGVVFLLTMVGRYADKYLHVYNSVGQPKNFKKPMGILPF